MIIRHYLFRDGLSAGYQVDLAEKLHRRRACPLSLRFEFQRSMTGWNFLTRRQKLKLYQLNAFRADYEWPGGEKKLTQSPRKESRS
jgi:hypothetical protein